MYLVIGEKPSVSQALAKVIGAYQKKDGFLLGRDCIVSWCVGHLAEYAPPEVYGETYKKLRTFRFCRKIGKFWYHKVPGNSSRY